MPENKVLKFKNYFLYAIVNTQESDPSKQLVVPSFQGWLIELGLHGTASRSRTRFIKLIMDRVEEIESERIRIAKEHSKNKKGEVEYLTKDGKKTLDEKQGVFNINDMAKFLQEWEDYLNEDYLIDVTPANNDDINGVKSILLNTTAEFKGRTAIRYDEWCEAFEDIYKKDTKKNNKKKE